MSNPLFGKNMQGPSNPIDSLTAFVNNGGNPQQAMQMLIGNNPQVKQMMTQLNNMRGNRSLEEFALEGAKQRGLDVNQIKNLAKRMGAK